FRGVAAAAKWSSQDAPRASTPLVEDEARGSARRDAQSPRRNGTGGVYCRSFDRVLRWGPIKTGRLGGGGLRRGLLCLVGVFCLREPARAAVSHSRVSLIGMRLPTPNLPPVQPVLTSQQSTLPFAIRSLRRLPYTDGWRGMNGAPKQVEKVACGSVTPISVPAT